MRAGVVNRPASIRRHVLPACLCILSATLFAQATGTTTGDLRGRVTDESGAARPEVLVTATNLETGLARFDPTGNDGTFTIRLLPPARYRVTATLEGFQPLEVNDVLVTLGSSTNLDLRLPIAEVRESVTVPARPGLLHPASTDVSRTIGEKMIRN